MITSRYSVLAANPTKPTGGNIKRATSVARQKKTSQGIKMHNNTIFVVLFTFSPPFKSELLFGNLGGAYTNPIIVSVP